MMTHADFREKLNLLTGILFPDPSGTDAETEIQASSSAPSETGRPQSETLRLFYAAFADHQDFMKGQYDICLPGEDETAGDLLILAREQQGVCAYGLDRSSGKVLCLDPAGRAEALDLPLEDFLLYLAALQSTGYCPCGGLIRDCAYLLEEKYSDLRITGAAGEGAVYCFEEGVVLAVSGKDAYASAASGAAMEAFERLRGLEADIF